MTDTRSPAPETQATAADRRPLQESVLYTRANYAAHLVEGALFLTAMVFLNAQTLLPTIVQSLGGPAWLISLMPVMMTVGFLLPPIFTAHWIERMPRYMPLLVITGIIQRLPYLLAAAALIYAAGTAPRLALATVALAPLISGLAGGVSVTGWQLLVMKTVPENRRPSLFAYRYLVSCAVGIVAGYVVKWLFDLYPGAIGYGVLHLIAFILLAGSMVFFCTIREPHCPVAAARPSVGLLDNWRAMPSLVAQDRAFALYLLARFFRNGLFVLTPFLAIHAQIVLQRPESYLGQLLVVQMVGAIHGNLFSGPIGDRVGGRIIMILGTLILMLLTAWAPLARSDLEFRLIFFLYGFGYYASEVGTWSLVMELCPRENRSSYLSLASLVNLPAMLLASWTSATIWELQHRITALALVTFICLALSAGFLLAIRRGAAVTAQS